MSENFKVWLFMFLIVPVLAYFTATLICFIQATTLYFNPLNWDIRLRVITAVFTFIFTLAGTVIAIIDDFKEKIYEN